MSQTVIQISTHPPVTNQGRVTSYLPVTSFPAVAECSVEIYSGVLFVAFNPFYGQDILTSITCLPQAVTLWWQQTTPQTTTELGPIVCPDLYTTASTSIVNSLTTFVACCPNSYTFNKLVPVSNVGECNSPLSRGQEVSFATFVSSSWIPGTTTITAPGSSVSGVHINGYVFAEVAASTSSASSTSATPAVIPATEPTISTTPVSTTPLSNSSPTTSQSHISLSTSGLTTGTKIGIGIGVPLAALGICSLLLAFILFRRSNKARWQMENIPMESSVLKSELPTTEYRGEPVARQWSSPPSAARDQLLKQEQPAWQNGQYNAPHEIGYGRHIDIHEIGSTFRASSSDHW